MQFVSHGTRCPSKEEYTAVSKQLVQKYPVLKDSTGNGYVSSTYIQQLLVYVCVCLCMSVGACAVCLCVLLCVCICVCVRC